MEFPKLLQSFAETPGEENVLSLVADEVLMPTIAGMSDLEIYMTYLTIIAFPKRSIKHGKILVSKMLEIKALYGEYLEKELENKHILPEWVKEIFENYSSILS